MLDVSTSTLNHHFTLFPSSSPLLTHFLLSKSARDWALQVCQALVISHRHLALDMILQIKIHRSQISWKRWPRAVEASKTTSFYPTVSKILIEPVPHTLRSMTWGSKLSSGPLGWLGKTGQNSSFNKLKYLSPLTFSLMKKG